MLNFTDGFLLIISDLNFKCKIPSPSFKFGGQTGSREAVVVFSAKST
jgi:hypothetical protein